MILVSQNITLFKVIHEVGNIKNMFYLLNYFGKKWWKKN